MQVYRIPSLILVCGMVLPTSCKPDEVTSETYTLDNMTRTGELVMNQCGKSANGLADMRDEAIALAERHITVPDELRSVLYASLSSVPPNLKNAFFELGYKIEVSGDIASKCNVPAYDQQESVASCLQQEAIAISPSETGEQITIHLDANEDNIRHATVRAFFLALTKSIAFIKRIDGELVVTQDEHPEFRAWKSSLALAVIQEVSRNKEMSLQAYSQLLPNYDVFFSPQTTDAQRLQMWQSWEATSPVQASTFKDFIIAEAADSFYCSETSKETMRSQFSEAHRLFSEQLDPALRQLWSDEDSSLGLVSYRRARWFPGRNIGQARRGQLMQNRQQTGFYRPRLAGYRRPWDGSRTWVRPPAWGSGQRLGWRNQY